MSRKPWYDLHRYPPGSVFFFHELDGSEIKSCRGMMTDLADELMMHPHDRHERNLLVELRVNKQGWRWSEANLRRLEEQFRYDLTFDGYDVRSRRWTDLTTEQIKAKARIWRLNIWTPGMSPPRRRR